jgi:hypothetical protein
MYSALYAADCQEKRVLILAVMMAEGNLSVKNLSYLLSSFTKGAVAPDPGPPRSAQARYPPSQAMTEVFPKMTI